MITPRRMAAVDANAAALGVPEKQLMESSGNAVARAVRERTAPGAPVVVVSGRGNNGGDALVAARFLDDREVAVSLLGRPESISTAIARENWEALATAAYDPTVVRDSAALDLGDPDLIVDGLLGTGAAGAPREPEASAVRAINAADATVVSVDVPSGVDAGTGESPGTAVSADHVVTFHDRKPGLDEVDASVEVADIGIPAAAETFVGPGDLQALSRRSGSHKGDHGEVLVVGGGPYAGAPALAGRAALRAGADLVRVACPEAVAHAVQGYSENLIVRPLSGDLLGPDHVADLLAWARAHDVAVLGPGLGDADAPAEVVRAFLEAFDGRAVVDADALRVVPEVRTDATLVCTPHRGELREMGGPSAEGWRDRADAEAAFAAELGHVLLVKGPHDIATDGERARVNRTGNPGMTVGGTGDVLAGTVGALLARALDPLDAAAVGAYANGSAGDAAVEETGYGMVATDLLDRLPATLGGGGGD